MINIHTDGACSGNGTKASCGGWAAIIECNGFEIEISGGFAPATNQQAELLAAIHAIEFLKKPSEIMVTSDSKYVIDGITSWIKNWLKNGWVNSKKQPVENRGLWERLHAAIQDGQHVVTWNWVKGHAGHPLNERVDALARGEVEKLRN